MYLENARALGQGIMLLIFAAVAYWVDVTVGLVLVALMGLLIFQSAFTDKCPSDPLWRLMKFRKKLESKE